MTGKVVIVGSGQAGVQAAFSLRDEGFAGEITVIGEEPGLPYQRPPLSKTYLLGKLDAAGLSLKAAELYGEYGIELRDGFAAREIDRRAHRLMLSTGEAVPYDELILATGARQRILDVGGAGLDGVLTLRTFADAVRLRRRLDGARRAVVVGAGFIGLEFAAVARARGVAVTVVELGDRPLGRALSLEMASYLHERHVAWGVDFVFETALQAIEGEGAVHRVLLEGGSRLEADLVLVGVGVVPNTELAAAAGLPVGDGIRVDEFMVTGDPAISAIGDCALHPNVFSAGGPVRIESVQNATDQARCVASRIAGRPRPYGDVPWFWSDQGDQKLQIAGLAAGHDMVVVRGDPASGAFSVFCFKNGRLLAVESVNRGPDHVMARRLIAARATLSPLEAANDAIPLKQFLTG